MIKITLFFLLLLSVFSSCQISPVEIEKSNTFDFEIKNLSDTEYPDNPDIGFRAKDYKNDWFTNGEIKVHKENSKYLNFQFLTKEKGTIEITNLDISEFIPTIPKRLKKDYYLSYIACINQEWNRNQVKFLGKEFIATNKNIVRVDLARNCLNAYLWEIILYVKEGEKIVPYAHGWFDFPNNLYATLFENKNNVAYASFKKGLENWKDPENYTLKLNLLRSIISPIPVSFSDSSSTMYPLEGARKKKFKEIIYPKKFATMKDLQTDSSLFATFSPPGFYNKKDPRKTELGRIYNLKNLEVNRTKNPNISKETKEIQLTFLDKKEERQTKLVIGGLNFKDFPVLHSSKANDGWKNSMGFGNHTFYETYTEHNETKAELNPYYAFFTDGENKWLDSHKIGVDGPIFYFSDESRKRLHVWLLSFERHAFVGHYVLLL